MTEEAWQLKMFRQSLKKQQKLGALLKLMGATKGQRCLLVTCGDNNGALNWYFRQHGGDWTWADVGSENLAEMAAFLEEPVMNLVVDQWSLANDSYDVIVAIDVLEHLVNDQAFLVELKRVLKPGGQAVVTVPNGDPRLLSNRIKWAVGMTPEVYGHTRAGYTLSELADSLQRAGFETHKSGGYSRFFTEIMELVINFAYVKVLSRKKQREGQIAPTSSGELKTHGGAYKIYSLLYPIMNLISQLDKLLPNSLNNAVALTATKSGNRP